MIVSAPPHVHRSCFDNNMYKRRWIVVSNASAVPAIKESLFIRKHDFFKLIGFHCFTRDAVDAIADSKFYLGETGLLHCSKIGKINHAKYFVGFRPAVVAGHACWNVLSVDCKIRTFYMFSTRQSFWFNLTLVERETFIAHQCRHCGYASGGGRW